MMCEVRREAMAASLGEAGVPGARSLSEAQVMEVLILESELVRRWVLSFLGSGGGVEGTSG